MSYDRIWVCPSLDTNSWKELMVDKLGPVSEEEKRRLLDEYAPGSGLASRFAVVTSAGKTCAIDEIYLFQTQEDAETFYETDVEKGEFVVVETGELMGFQEISLYFWGKRMKTRAVTRAHGEKAHA